MTDKKEKWEIAKRMRQAHEDAALSIENDLQKMAERLANTYDWSETASIAKEIKRIAGKLDFGARQAARSAAEEKRAIDDLVS